MAVGVLVDGDAVRPTVLGRARGGESVFLAAPLPMLLPEPGEDVVPVSLRAGPTIVSTAAVGDAVDAAVSVLITTSDFLLF